MSQPFDESVADIWDVCSIPDSTSDVGSWQLLQPTPKALPRPFLSRSCDVPRFRAPFQVNDMVSAAPKVREHSVVASSAAQHSGLQPPAFDKHFHQSRSLADSLVQGSSSGLPAPNFTQSPPCSLLDDAVDIDSMPMVITGSLGSSELVSSAPSPCLQKLGSVPKHSTLTSNLTRIKLASKSPIVWSLWLQFSAVLQTFSGVLQQLTQSSYVQEHAERFLNQFAATTLLRYMQSTLQFIQLCKDLHIDLQALTESQLADVLICGSLARRADGSGPKCSVTIKALRWCCKQLDVKIFASAFGSMISSFERQKIPVDRKESLPFPLFIIMKWERRILQSQATLKEIVILGGLLLLCWSGLRFSDLQRSQLQSWFLDEESLRGLTWRAKTCSTATPFGVCNSGLLSQGNWTWVHKYLQTLDRMYASQPLNSIDFALPAFRDQEVPCQPFDAMTYAEALYYIRYYMQLPWSHRPGSLQVPTSSYTVHGLKATLLSWAAQTEISPDDRRMHGKHKPAQMSVQLYSRDDIIGSIRLQKTLISHILQGWRPSTPLARGGQAPLLEPEFTLERFRKQVDSMTWNFFQFDQQSCLQLFVGASDPDPQPESSAEASDSSSESSDDSESSESVHAAPAFKKQKAVLHPPVDQAEECVFGIHRKTWHIMVSTTAVESQLPQWNGVPLKTACGRQLIRSRIEVGDELKLAFGQSLCSHIGCRKGFISTGLSD